MIPAYPVTKPMFPNAPPRSTKAKEPAPETRLADGSSVAPNRLATKALCQQGPASLQAVDIHMSLSKRTILNGISIAIQQREIVGIFGPDGAGKSTTLLCLAGLLRSDLGRILLNGEDVSTLPFYRRAILGIGYLPQQPSIFKGLTVAQNVMSTLEVVEPNPLARESRLADLLASLHIDGLRDAKATSLSGGERRRCEVARALAVEPLFMLLDEPFAGIDPITIASIKSLVLDMRDRGIGVLLTDQNVPEMLEIIDRAYVIDKGSLIFSGTPDAMLQDSLVIERYLGRDR